MGKTNNHLVLKSTQLWEGASDPEVKLVLTQIGLDESKMDRLKTETLEYTSAKHLCAVFLSNQKQSTVMKDLALKEAKHQLADLASLFRLLFRNSSFRSMLNMSVTTQTVEGGSTVESPVGLEGEETPASGETQQPEVPRRTVRRSMAQASIRGRLTQALDNIDALPQEVLSTLAEFGWDEARINQAREKLEAYKVSYGENKRQIGLYREHVRATVKKRKALEQLYRGFSLQIRRNLERFETGGERLRNIARAI